jgi:hypothetical protein
MMTQVFHDAVKSKVDEFRVTEAGRSLFSDEALDHKEARAVAKVYSLTLHIIRSNDPYSGSVVVRPRDRVDSREQISVDQVALR